MTYIPYHIAWVCRSTRLYCIACIYNKIEVALLWARDTTSYIHTHTNRYQIMNACLCTWEAKAKWRDSGDGFGQQDSDCSIPVLAEPVVRLARFRFNLLSTAVPWRTCAFLARFMLAITHHSRMSGTQASESSTTACAGRDCKWESRSLIGTDLPKLTRPFSGAGSIYLPALDRNIKRVSTVEKTKRCWSKVGEVHLFSAVVIFVQSDKDS